MDEQNIVLGQSQEENENKNNSFDINKAVRNVEKVIAIVLCSIFLALGIYSVDYVVGDSHNYFNFNKDVANYHTIERCLKFSNTYSRITNKNSKQAWYFRRLLMERYIRIKNSYGDNFYNSSGLFYSIINDFRFLYELNENNKNITSLEKEQYERYKQQFSSELYSLVMEYRYRNESIRNFIRFNNHRRGIVYSIPNRITFYPELAGLYLALFVKDFPINEETLNHLVYIYETFDIVYNQEKEKNTRSYTSINRTISNKKQMRLYYPLFVIDYTRNIILLSSILHPEVSICSTSDVCTKYKNMIKETGSEIDPKIKTIIE